MTQDPKPFWRDRRVLDFYKRDQPYRDKVARKVLAESPRRVLEFGCNVGRNLVAIRQMDPSVYVAGVDIAPRAVAYGRKTWDLPLSVGDETWLASQRGYAWDVVFTVSVLDHIPDPDPVMAELLRISRVAIFVEPWMGREGDVTEEGYTPNSVTWSWDIPSRLRDAGRHINSRKFPLSDDAFGGGLAGIYRSYTVRR